MNTYTYLEEARFWEKVEISLPHQCWEWRGANRQPGSYGWWTRYDPLTQKSRLIAAHRVAYELCHGQIPTKQKVCHHCDNPICVNPWHLFTGTHAQNMADMAHKGRATKKRGEQVTTAVLTENQVREVFALYNTGRYTQEQIGSKFGVNQTTISSILIGANWGHLGLKAFFQRRLEGLAEVNAAKTHCPKGHPYDETNVSIYRGHRTCKVCNREKSRRYRLKSRGLLV